MQTVYIVPASTDQAGQCRIVAAKGTFDSPRDSYQAHPELWKEIGIMNSAGKIVCLQATPQMTDSMKDCEPLIAGSYFQFDI
ncbi:conserved hypothetical protein [Acidithiobacillus ferrivorans]|uniref:Uncharacterized protein n=1 Tax=Acidithiobacillus ferrivorans TaxID=160808 RepID=A0A060UPY5_9PROT|nr:hypothetical protein [Acidithiobacillus ferrivorans]CDQ10682.1 conserved hypothetical protein [Acidithiobacillus ferrivorans]